MGKPESGGKDAVPVWVHRLRIFGPADSEQERVTVRCPVEHTTREATSCVACSNRVEVQRSPSGAVEAIHCRVPEHDASKAVHSPARTPVSEVMSTEVSAVSPEVSGTDLVRVLVERGVAGAPVVNAHGRPLGVVSVTDLIREVYDEVEDPHDDCGPPPMEELTAAELMTSPAICVRWDTPVAAAAAVMAFEKVHRLPVVSERGDVIGVVGTLDILRWLAAENGYILPPRDPARGA